jgi:hypothetical protein
MHWQNHVNDDVSEPQMNQRWVSMNWNVMSKGARSLVNNGLESLALGVLLGGFLAVPWVVGVPPAAAEEPTQLEAPHAGAKEDAPPQPPQLLSVEVIPDGAAHTAEKPSVDVHGARASTVGTNATTTHEMR